MRYCEDCDPETYNETYHCTDCGWEGRPLVARSRTRVPFGSTYADLDDFELHCPECKTEAVEGGLPEGLSEENKE
jgi:hypothetical protein